MADVQLLGGCGVRAESVGSGGDAGVIPEEVFRAAFDGVVSGFLGEGEFALEVEDGLGGAVDEEVHFGFGHFASEGVINDLGEGGEDGGLVFLGLVGVAANEAAGPDLHGERREGGFAYVDEEEFLEAVRGVGVQEMALGFDDERGVRQIVAIVVRIFAPGEAGAAIEVIDFPGGGQGLLQAAADGGEIDGDGEGFGGFRERERSGPWQRVGEEGTR